MSLSKKTTNKKTEKPADTLLLEGFSGFNFENFIIEGDQTYNNINNGKTVFFGMLLKTEFDNEEFDNNSISDQVFKFIGDFTFFLVSFWFEMFNTFLYGVYRLSVFSLYLLSLLPGKLVFLKNLAAHYFKKVFKTPSGKYSPTFRARFSDFFRKFIHNLSSILSLIYSIKG